jgi:lipoate-protein ligase A
MRVVAAGLCEPAEALALDEAVVRAEPAAPVLILWRTRPAVVIGRFQRADWEVDAGECAARGVRVWRRFTGGGAVHLDPGTLCVGRVVPAGHPDAALGVPELYAPFLDGIVRACRGLDIPASRDERTVRVGDRKVTGVAAHRGRRATLVHGTLLVDADLDALVACLAGPRGGSLDGRPRPAGSRPDDVTNVGVAMAAAQAAVIAAFAGDGAAEGPPSPRELELAASLRRERYGDRDWHAGPWRDVTPENVRAVLGEELHPPLDSRSRPSGITR